MCARRLHSLPALASAPLHTEHGVRKTNGRKKTGFFSRDHPSQGPYFQDYDSEGLIREGWEKEDRDS